MINDFSLTNTYDKCNMCQHAINDLKETDIFKYPYEDFGRFKLKAF